MTEQITEIIDTLSAKLGVASQYVVTEMSKYKIASSIVPLLVGIVALVMIRFIYTKTNKFLAKANEIEAARAKERNRTPDVYGWLPIAKALHCASLDLITLFSKNLPHKTTCKNSYPADQTRKSVGALSLRAANMVMDGAGSTPIRSHRPPTPRPEAYMRLRQGFRNKLILPRPHRTVSLTDRPIRLI